MRAEILKKINENSLKVNLVNMKIEDNEILDIMAAIKKNNPTVSVINLDSNKISDQGATWLSQCLCDFAHLKELSLQFNNIGREGAIDIFSLKKNFADLDILFRGNKIINAREMDDIERLARGGSSLRL